MDFCARCLLIQLFVIMGGLASVLGSWLHRCTGYEGRSWRIFTRYVSFNVATENFGYSVVFRLRR